MVSLDADDHTWEFGDNHSGITTFVASGSDPWRGTITTNDLLSGAVVYGGFTITLRHGGEVELQTPQLVAAVEG